MNMAIPPKDSPSSDELVGPDTGQLFPADDSSTPSEQLTHNLLHGQKIPVTNYDGEDDFSFLKPAVEPGELGRLGNYRVLYLLGKGGMAYVFRAEDLVLRRSVALKVMKPHLDSLRFVREAQNLAKIKHDNLVTIYQVGQEGKVAFLAMELLEGETLDQWVGRDGPRSPMEVLRIGKEIAAGLQAIHQKSLIHRDIKPGNLFHDAETRRVKILDFGLARLVDDDAAITATGIVVGTPAFMSPEQARGIRLDARSDLFSLGSVLYYLATGSHPFDAKQTMAVLTALAVDDPRPVYALNPNMPRAVSNFVAWLLAKKPEDRPASADVVVQGLRRLEADATPSWGDPSESPAHGTQVLTPSQLALPPDARSHFASHRWKYLLGGFLAFALTVGTTVGIVLLVLPPPPRDFFDKKKGPPPAEGFEGKKGPPEGKKGPPPPPEGFEGKKGPPPEGFEDKKGPKRF